VTAKNQERRTTSMEGKPLPHQLVLLSFEPAIILMTRKRPGITCHLSLAESSM
jgi:hypothetical protein